MQDIDELSELYLFRGVPRSAIRELCAMAPPTRWAAGTVLFREGDVADQALLLVKGRLVATVEGAGEPRKLGDISPGEVVGEAALFGSDAHRSATVTAETDSHCLVVTRELLVEGRENMAIVAMERFLLGTMARRLRNTNQAIRILWKEAAADEAAAQPGPLTFRDRLARLFGGS